MADAPFIVVDTALDTPPYVQIVEQIRGAILRGDLPGNAALPTVRQLAGDLGVAPNTVARAYTDLQSSGWLVGEGRRGTRVADPSPAIDDGERDRVLQESVTRFVSTLSHRGFSKAQIAAAFRAVPN
jgi:DNA-binding transcriptional regulator YhcF (GntR family)